MVNVVEVQGLLDALKDITGIKGDTGATPDITITATADALSSDNPSVTVTKTGTDEEPSFALAFSGLKGAPGSVDFTGAHAGQVLTAIEDAGGHLIQGWTNNNDVPVPVAADENKVLTANDDGTYDWATAAGGGASVYGSYINPAAIVSDYDAQTSTTNYYAYGSGILSNDGKTMAQAVAGDMVWASVASGSGVALYVIDSFVSNYSWYGDVFKLKSSSNTLQTLVTISFPKVPTYVTKSFNASVSTASDLVTEIQGCALTGMSFTNPDRMNYQVALLVNNTDDQIKDLIDITRYVIVRRDQWQSNTPVMKIIDTSAFSTDIAAIMTSLNQYISNIEEIHFSVWSE